MAPFSETQPEGEMDRIVRLTARKMSADGRARVLAEFPMPDEFAQFFRAE